MHIIFDPIQLRHSPRHEFLDGRWTDYLESPRRAEMILAALEAAQVGEASEPDDFGLAPIRAVHSAPYLDFLQTIYERWVAEGRPPEGVYPDTFLKPQFTAFGATHRPAKAGALAGQYLSDLSAVITQGTWAAACASAQCALTAAERVRAGARAAFALCRPPGHHAHADMGGGYCFLNNVAIAAEHLVHLPARNDSPPNPEVAGLGTRSNRVAILDVDYHHGNGTQAIFYERDDVLFVSIHADPCFEYPYFSGAAEERGCGAGEGFNLNFPLPKGTADEAYLRMLDRACEAIGRFDPHYLLVSLGVDTFGGDPLGTFALTADVYPQIGARLAQLERPTVFIMEGGYAIEQLGRNVAGVLCGFEQSQARVADD